MVHVTFQNLCCRAMLFAQVRTSSQNGKRARGGRGPRGECRTKGPWPGRSDQTRGAPHSLSSSEQRATGVSMRRKLLKLGVPQRDPDGQQKREELISEQKGDAFVRRQSPGLRKKTHSVTSRHILYGEPPTPERFWMSGSCDGVPHPANDRAKTANSKARKRRIFTSQLVIANEPIMVRSILMSIQVGGKMRQDTWWLPSQAHVAARFGRPGSWGQGVISTSALLQPI